MILLIDNYDSFVHNLQRYFVRLSQQVDVVRNDRVRLEQIGNNSYQAIVLSPGPCGPDEAGQCLEVVERYKEHLPMLGVCLGHQVIWQALGGRIRRARAPMHGRASQIHFVESPLFTRINSPFTAARYHSLVSDEQHAPPYVRVTAWAEDGEIMAFEHTCWPLFGIQFHPESILTSCGYQLLANFLAVAGLANAGQALPKNDLNVSS